MIEKYLKDSITEPDRKAKIETISKLNLMPARIVEEIRVRDSITRAKNAKIIINKEEIKTITDTTGIEDDENSDALNKLNNPDQSNLSVKDTVPAKKDDTKKIPSNGVLPDKQQKIKKD
jgi:hypothetical protein